MYIFTVKCDFLSIVIKGKLLTADTIPQCSLEELQQFGKKGGDSD